MRSKHHLNMRILQKWPQPADETISSTTVLADSLLLTDEEDSGERRIKWNRKGATRETKVWLPTFVHCLQFACTLVPSGELPL